MIFLKKLIAILLTGIMLISAAVVYAEDVSSGVFGTEYLENAKELEFEWNITKNSYWELYVYNHSTEMLKIEINKGTRNIHSLEVASKQTAAIYGDGNFDEAVYTVKAVSMGNENLCGKLSYQITNNSDNLQRKIPDNLTDMSGMSSAPKNNVVTVFRPVEIKPVLDNGKTAVNNNIIVLKPSPQTEAVDELVRYGIMKGDPDGNLRHGDYVTRAEAIVMLLRSDAIYSGLLKDYLYRPAFDDIANHWAAKEITFAHENSLVDGTSLTSFEPENNITIQEFAKMLVTLLGYREMAEQRGGYPNGYLTTANSLGIFNNMNKEISQNAQRRDIALMIYNSLDVPLMKQTGFGAKVEYSIMDGKNGTKLQTLRTMLDETASVVPRFNGPEYTGRLLQIGELKKTDSGYSFKNVLDDKDNATYIVDENTFVYLSNNTVELSEIKDSMYAQCWHYSDAADTINILKIELMKEQY